MSWLEKLLPPQIQRSDSASRKSIPEGLWVKCPSCEAVLYRTDLESNLHVCPKCSHHMRMHGRERLQRFLDQDSGVEIGAGIQPEDPLRFKDSKRYTERLKTARAATGDQLWWITLVTTVAVGLVAYLALLPAGLPVPERAEVARWLRRARAARAG